MVFQFLLSCATLEEWSCYLLTLLSSLCHCSTVAIFFFTHCGLTVVGNTSISELSPGSKTAAGSTIHKTERKVLPYWPGRIGGQQKNRKWGNKVLCNATLLILCWGLNNIFSIWKWRMTIAVNFQFKQSERRSLKKSGLQPDSNLWPNRYRCDALPTELHVWSHTLGARPIYWVHISREEWNHVKYI